MNSSSLLGIGTRALAANLAALQVTGNNIANVNTPGYSRQVVQFGVSGTGKTGADSGFGTGGGYIEVVRSHNAFLSRLATLTLSAAAADEARSDKLAMIEPAFVPGEGGIGAGINAALNAFADVAAAPLDASARQLVISRLDEMAARFRSAMQQIDAVAAGVNDEIAQSLSQVNGFTRQIATLNSEIANLLTRGDVPNDLLDRRDHLIDQLNAVVQTSSVPMPDGTVSLFLGGTQPLVLGGNSLALTSAADPFDTSLLQIRVQTPSGPSTVEPSQLTGGSLAGLWAFQRVDLPDARNQLGRLAMSTALLMNELHHLGYDLRGNPGADLLGVSVQGQALSSSANTGNAQLSVSADGDITAFQASDYEVFVQAGQVTLTRLSDGEVSNHAGFPVQLDGITIALDSGTAQPGDRFVLRPFAAAARDITAVLHSPTALAMAAPVAATPAAANSGDVRIASLQAVAADANLQQPVQITFSGSGTYSVTGAGTGNPVNLSYVPGQPIEFNGWRLVLSGTPAAGDVIDIAASASGTRNAQQAQGFLALRDAAIFDGSTLSSGYATVLAQVGARIQGAQMSSQTSRAMADQAGQSKASVAGVNLDEEAARLLQFQQAYQAAARILQTADTVFKSLIGGIGQ